MKFSVVTGLNEGNVLPEKILKRYTELCEFLKPLGYKGIELAILEPEKIPVKKLKDISDSYEIEIPALGTGSTFLRFRYSLGDTNPIIREKAIDRIKKYIEFATISDSKIIIGLIRGRYSYGNNPQHEKTNITDSLKKCSKLAEENNVEFIFEPINSFEVDSYNTIQESLNLLEEIGTQNIKLMVDSFHIHLEEDPKYIWSYLKSIVNRIAHIHLADDTRRAPGTGNFDFKKFLSIFEDTHFLGFASIETIMKPSFHEVAKQTLEYIKSLNIKIV